MSCLLSCPVFSCLVLSCPLPCLVLSCPVLSYVYSVCTDWKQTVSLDYLLSSRAVWVLGPSRCGGQWADHSVYVHQIGRLVLCYVLSVLSWHVYEIYDTVLWVCFSDSGLWTRAGLWDVAKWTVAEQSIAEWSVADWSVAWLDDIDVGSIPVFKLSFEHKPNKC